MYRCSQPQCPSISLEDIFAQFKVQPLAKYILKVNKKGRLQAITIIQTCNQKMLASSKKKLSKQESYFNRKTSFQDEFNRRLKEQDNYYSKRQSVVKPYCINTDFNNQGLISTSRKKKFGLFGQIVQTICENKRYSQNNIQPQDVYSLIKLKIQNQEESNNRIKKSNRKQETQKAIKNKNNYLQFEQKQKKQHYIQQEFSFDSSKEQKNNIICQQNDSKQIQLNSKRAKKQNENHQELNEKQFSQFYKNLQNFSFPKKIKKNKQKQSNNNQINLNNKSIKKDVHTKNQNAQKFRTCIEINQKEKEFENIKFHSQKNLQFQKKNLNDKKNFYPKEKINVLKKKIPQNNKFKTNGQVIKEKLFGISKNNSEVEIKTDIYLEDVNKNYRRKQKKQEKNDSDKIQSLNLIQSKVISYQKNQNESFDQQKITTQQPLKFQNWKKIPLKTNNKKQKHFEQKIHSQKNTLKQNVPPLPLHKKTVNNTKFQFETFRKPQPNHVFNDEHDQTEQFFFKNNKKITNNTEKKISQTKPMIPRSIKEHKEHQKKQQKQAVKAKQIESYFYQVSESANKKNYIDFDFDTSVII